MEQTCRDCGANIDVAMEQETGEPVPLEKYTDASTDAQRYRVVELNPLTVAKVAKDAPGDFYPDHRYDCPAHNDGR